MATSKYDLHTIDYSVQGWDSILATDMEKLDDVIHTRLAGTAGEAISQYNAVYFKSDGKFWKAQADGTKQPCLGLALESAAVDVAFRVQRVGLITNSGWAWTVGAKIYLDPSTAGALTATAPTTNSQLIGIAKTATSIFLTLILEDILAGVGLGYVPYRVTSTGKLGSSPISTDGTDIDISGALSQTYGKNTQTMLLHFKDLFSDYVKEGCLPATSANLTSDISAGVAYSQGRRVVKAVTSRTYTASKDTYVDLKGDGTYLYSEVANGAAAPAVAADSIRLAKVITDVDNITGVTDLRTLYKRLDATNNLAIMDGNVGIGTTAPETLLQIGGTFNAARYAQISNVGVGIFRFDDNSLIDSLIVRNKGLSAANQGIGIRFELSESGGTESTAGRVIVASEVPWTITAADRDSYMGFYTLLDNVLVEKMRITGSGNVGIGTTTPKTRLTVAGPLALAAPATKTAAYSLVATDASLIFNGGASITLTLQAAVDFPGRILYVKTIAAYTVVSASANVAPLDSATAGTAILAATAGKWAMLQSDGVNWITMAGN